MEKNSKFGLHQLADTRVLVVALAVAGVLFVQIAPLENTRLPVTEPQSVPMREVDARSWQDPFAAIAKHRDDLKKASPKSMEVEEKANDFSNFVMSLGREPFEVMAVMLPGGPYSEDGETRRRMRYAVVSALNARHFRPDETERLGYFIRTSKNGGLPDHVPYQWYDGPPDHHERILVLWLRADDYETAPLQKLSALREGFLKSAVGDAPWRIIGPYGSAGVKALIEETAEGGFPFDKRKRVPLLFYSPFATVPDAFLLGKHRTIDAEQQSRPLEEYFDAKGITFVRSIGTDDRLAMALVREFRLRGIAAQAETDAKDPGSCNGIRKRHLDSVNRIAILVEKDTTYGDGVQNALSSGLEAQGFCVEGFDYLRGLDGELPPTGDGSSKAENTTSKAQGASGAGGEATTSSELAAGQHQFDYLRRLARRLHEHDSRVRSTDRYGRGLRAVGVLATDVHDKLLILQALRSELPDVIFFTTDIDARLLHPREQPWTRNLLIVSSLGLQLNEEMQGGSAPFRDSYQTALFLAARLALAEVRATNENEITKVSEPVKQDRVEIWMGLPRVFEVGRTTAFDFSDDRPSQPCNWRLDDQCQNIQPAPSNRYPIPAPVVLAVSISLILLLLWAPLVILTRQMAPLIAWVNSGRRRMAVVLAALLVHVALPFWVVSRWPSFADWITRDGSPITFFEGISPWPTEAIRLATLIVACYFVIAIRASEDRNLGAVGALLHGPDREGKPGSGTHVDGTPSFLLRHIQENTFTAQSLRSLWIVVPGAAVGTLVFLFGGINTADIRGSIGRGVHEFLLFALLLMFCFVVGYVVSIVISCVLFIKHLPTEIENWKDETRNVAEAQLGGPKGKLFAIWVELQVISLRTRAVSSLVYYPFILSSLLMLSTGTLFGTQRIPMGPVILTLGAVTLAVAGAWWLSATAECARELALRHIDEQLLRHAAASNPDSESSAVLQQLRSHVAGLDEGAFAPFWQQTMFYALLIPFAIIGSSSRVSTWLAGAFGSY